VHVGEDEFREVKHLTVGVDDAPGVSIS